MPINNAGDTLQAGMPVPEGWLLAPHDSTVSGLTAADVDLIVAQGVEEALRTRAAIRLNIDAGFRPGARTGMVLSVADTNGELLGVYRMPDATIFSIDVSIAKARNTAYYADPADLQDEDRIDFNGRAEIDARQADDRPVNHAQISFDRWPGFLVTSAHAKVDRHVQHSRAVGKVHSEKKNVAPSAM